MNARRSIRWFTSSLLAVALTGSAVLAQDLPGLPQRQPEEGGGKFYIQLFVPYSTLGLDSGRNESFSGFLGFHQPSGPTYIVKTDLPLRGPDGDVLAPAEEIFFRLDADGHPKGGGEELPSGTLPEELRYRNVPSTDFALLPLRMLRIHEMPSGSGDLPAAKEQSGDGYHVEWSQRFRGVETISRTPLQKFSARTIRTFKPSGFQLIDYTLTYEDKRDDTMMGAFGVRMLVHPSHTLENGERPPAGVFHIAQVQVQQLDWIRVYPVIPPNIWSEHIQRWFERLGDELFDAIGDEAIGSPFDSPAAFAIRALKVMTPRTLQRMTSGPDPKRLAVIAPLLVDLPVAYDPKPFDRSYELTADPVQRVLLCAAAAAADGPERERYLRVARLALHSKDDDTRRAAFYLARALREPGLVPDISAAIGNCRHEDDTILGCLAAGVCGGEDSLSVLEELLEASRSERQRAAALRALADVGDQTIVDVLDAPGARFGVLNPRTGRFEVLITDEDEASAALRTVCDLANAARGARGEEVLDALVDALMNEKSDYGPESALAIAATEWLVRLDGCVAGLADELDDPVARRVVRGSGRMVVDDIIADMMAATGDEKMALAKLVGATKDPRAKAALKKLQDSDVVEEYDAGDAGYAEFIKEN